MDKQERYILRQIRRQLSKEEAIQFLLKQNSDLQFEVGVLKSEIDQLNFEMSKKTEKNDFSKSIRLMQETIFRQAKEIEALKQVKIKHSAFVKF